MEREIDGIIWREGRPLAPLGHCSQFTRGGGLEAIAGFKLNQLKKKPFFTLSRMFERI